MDALSVAAVLVDIKLIGLFQKGRFNQRGCSYPVGTTVRDIALGLDLPRQLLGIFLVNGIHANFETVLEDGDQLVLMPIIGGG